MKPVARTAIDTASRTRIGVRIDHRERVPTQL